jgi:glycosyltransferase involved in cell wall biosynthesis
LNGVDFILTTSALGGAEMFTLELARACAEQVDVSIVTQPGSPLEARAEEIGLHVRTLQLGSKLGRRTLPVNASRYWAARRRLSAEIASGAAEDRWSILQFKWEELLWAGEVAASRVCLIEHGPIPSDLVRIPWARQRLVRAFRRAAVVMAVSDPAETSVAETTGRRPDRLQAGLDPVRVAAARSVSHGLRAAVSGDAALVAVYVGRLTSAKGVHHLADLVDAYPGIAAVFVGDGPERHALEARAARNSRLKIVGHVVDPLPYIAAADASVLLSTEAGEGRPLAALESLAVGRPVIGLSSTPALAAMAAEFGSDRVHLVDSSKPSIVRNALMSARSPVSPPSIPSWSDVALELTSLLARATEARDVVAA